MQISMEILSQIATRADSGAGVKQKTLAVMNAIPSFERILEQSQKVMEYPVFSQGGKHGGRIDKEDSAAMLPEKPDEDIDEGESAIAGVIVNPNMIVIILDGNKETTAPDITNETVADIDALPKPAANAIAIEAECRPAATDARPEPETQEIANQSVEINAADVKTSVSLANVNEAPVKAADTGSATKAETAGIGDTNDAGATGETMARTPEIRPQQQQGYEKNDSEPSEKGDLCPLENENDKKPFAAQKEKAYSDKEDAARGAAQGVKEQINDMPAPLAQGLKPEQFRADQQMKQAMPDSPVKAENLFDEMVSRFETMQNENKSAMTIQLKPEFLGNVTLEIAMDAAGLSVKINAQNSDVRNIINGQINSLVETLQNKGIAVTEVEVAYTGVNNGAFKDSREGQAKPDSQRRVYRGGDVAESAAYYMPLSYDMLDYYLDTEVSSVEYRA